MSIEYFIKFADIGSRNRYYGLECTDGHYAELLELLQKLKSDLINGSIDTSVVYNTTGYYPTSSTFLSLVLDVLYEIMYVSESIMYNFDLDIPTIYNIFRTIKEIYEHIRTNIVIANKFKCRYALERIFTYRLQPGIPEPIKENVPFFNSIIDLAGMIMLDIILTGESPYVPYRSKYANESDENYYSSFPAVPDIVKIKERVQERLVNILDKTETKYIQYNHILNVINTVQNKYEEYIQSADEEVDDYLIPDLKNIVFGYFS